MTSAVNTSFVVLDTERSTPETWMSRSCVLNILSFVMSKMSLMTRTPLRIHVTLGSNPCTSASLSITQSRMIYLHRDLGTSRTVLRWYFSFISRRSFPHIKDRHLVLDRHILSTSRRSNVTLRGSSQMLQLCSWDFAALDFVRRCLFYDLRRRVVNHGSCGHCLVTKILSSCVHVHCSARPL